MPPEIAAEGERVWVRTVRDEDLPAYRRAVEQSRARISRWNPVNPDDLLGHLSAQSRSHRTFLLRASRPEGRHDVVGKVNVTNVVRGRMCSGAIGYDAYDPYAGRGLFSEGLRLVLGLALAAEPGGMGLHRIEASVQPGNVTSAGLLRSLGFRYEGFSPRLLWLGDAGGSERWRDHDRYALTAEEWPPAAYAEQDPPRLACVVSGAPEGARALLSRTLARELHLPLFSADVVTDVRLRYRLLAESPVGGVLELPPDEFEGLDEGLAVAGWEPVAVPVVWCRDDERAPGPSRATPRVLLEVDTSRSADDREVSRLAVEIRAVSASARPAPTR